MTPRTILRISARNTARHRVRTALTAGMVVLGVALLVVALSWVQGIFGQMLAAAAALPGHVRIVDPDYADREELMPLYENIPEVAPLLQFLTARPGVVATHPRITAGVTVTAGEEIGDVFALAVGAPPEYFDKQVGARDKLVSGRWFSGDPDEIIAGSRVVERIGARAGDEVVLLGLTQDGALSPIKGTLVGVVHAGNAFVDQQVFLPLEKAQWLTDIPDGATEILVYGEDYRGAGLLAAQLRELEPLAGYRVLAWNEREPWAGLTGTVDGVRAIIVFVIVFLTALGIWNTMTMSVLERTREIGVLRAMGLTRLGAVGLFVAEALAIAAGGGLVGVALGALPAWLLETRGIHLGEDLVGNFNVDMPVSETVYGDLSPEILLTAFALGLATALLGSIVPAFRAASIQPVAAMRTGV